MDSRAQPPHPGVRFPPPFLYAAGFLVGLGLERWVIRLPVSAPALRPWIAMAGWLAIVLGLAFIGWGLATFGRARTAIIPIRPASRLVAWGPYRFSRNPMYTGLAVLYVGLTLLFNVGWPLLLLPAVLALMYLLVIRREERYLAGAFGDEYLAYCRRVRRWL